MRGNIEIRPSVVFFNRLQRIPRYPFNGVTLNVKFFEDLGRNIAFEWAEWAKIIDGRFERHIRSLGSNRRGSRRGNQVAHSDQESGNLEESKNHTHNENYNRKAERDRSPEYVLENAPW